MWIWRLQEVNSIKGDLDHYTDKGMRSRQRIIEVAITLIRAQGYAETTIQKICAEVGIGIGTFYHYFRSKEEVLLAFIEAENKDLLAFYACQDKSSYGHALLAVADYYAGLYFFKGANLIAHIYSMMLFSTLPVGEINANGFHQILRDIFIQGQHSGEFSKNISADTFCNLALGEWFFFTSLWCRNPESFNIRETIADNYTQLLKLVAASG
jgi:AcrR family transcriptional regulator